MVHLLFLEISSETLAKGRVRKLLQWWFIYYFTCK